jgi:GNAT superfamily N-acetyltransferase
MKSSMTLQIRRAVRADVPRILELVRELAAYEREPDAVVATEADLVRDGFGVSPAFHVFLAEEDGRCIGFALYFYTFSTWAGRRCLHLEDLFVEPAHRGRGAGVALMRAVAREAVDKECARFIWQVLDWNQPAIDFYERLGARVMKEWIAARLDGDALTAFARGSAAPASPDPRV